MSTGERSPSDASIAQPRAGVSWRVFLVLLLMAAAGSCASVPMNVHVLKHLKTKSQGPVGVIVQGPSGAGHVLEPARSSAPDEDVLDDVIIMIPVELLITAVLIAVGLAAGTAIGLGIPKVRALLRSESSIRWPVLVSTGSGLGVGILGALLGFAFKSSLPPARIELPPPPAWAGILGSVGAGITEEIWFRLALMSGICWVCFRMMKQTEGFALIWLANGLAAIVFAAFHLPGNAAIAPLTTPVIMLGMLTRVPAGIVFGWLYWRHGLLAAMIGHMISDVVMVLAFLA
jgi:membrane protease YdiL (CAAX protease family)